jgi:plastocyanin
MKTTRIVIVIMALIAAGAFAAYSEEMKHETKADPGQTAQASEHDPGTFIEKRFVATVGADGVQHVDITGGDYFYDPNYIVVKVNTPVEFMVKKQPGWVPHDIMVKAPEAGIDFKVQLSDKPTPIKFTPTKVGKYQMYCDKRFLFFESHREKGMHGIIEVVP